MIKLLFDKLLYAIYPLKCPFCRNCTITPNDECCPSCGSSLPKFNQKVEILKYSNNYLPEQHIYFTAPYFYADSVKRALIDFKFKEFADFAIPLSVSMAKSFNLFFKTKDYDFISYIPLSKSNLRKRGYNQAKLLAKELSKRLNLPYKSTLIRSNSSLPQHKLTKIKRMENIFDAFSVSDNVSGSRILMVDDILTTSATLQSASCLLLENGVQRVDCICAAKSI